MSNTPPQSTKDAPCIQARSRGVTILGLLQLPEPWAHNCAHPRGGTPTGWGRVKGYIHASGH